MAIPSGDASSFNPVMYENTAPSPITGIRANSSRLVNCSVFLLSPPLVLLSEESFRKPVKTATPEISSIRLSPPNANRAKLPAMNPNPIDPNTSISIQAELRYSTLIPFSILACLHDRCAEAQQHEEQLEQS